MLQSAPPTKDLAREEGRGGLPNTSGVPDAPKRTARERRVWQLSEKPRTDSWRSARPGYIGAGSCVVGMPHSVRSAARAPRRRRVPRSPPRVGNGALLRYIPLPVLEIFTCKNHLLVLVHCGPSLFCS